MAWTTTISQPGTSAAAIVSASNGNRRVVQASVCNPTAGSQTLTVFFVPSGDTAADDTAVYNEVSIAPNATTVLSALINDGLAAGDEIHALASAGASLTVKIGVVDAA